MKEAVVDVVLLAGPRTIDVCGGVMSAGGSGSEVSSIVQLQVAGVGSAFPAASVARTQNWWEPSVKPAYDFGEVQLLQSSSSSIAHSKIEPGSLEEMKNFAEVEPVINAGPNEIDVWGGVVSSGASSLGGSAASLGGVVATAVPTAP